MKFRVADQKLPDSNISETWIVNSELSRKSAGFVNVGNFHRFGSFAGFFDRPSPFRYRFNFQATSDGHKPPNLGLFSRALWVVRALRVTIIDTVEVWLKLLFDRDYVEMTRFIPAKNFDSPAFRSAFFSFSGKKLNGSYIKSAEQFSLLDRFIDPDNVRSVCEIGAGFGAMAEIVVVNWHPKNYYIIDLPPSLDISYGYLSALASTSEIEKYANFEVGKWREGSITLGNSEIFFLDATENDFQKLRDVGLFLNSNSFGEMNSETLKRYLDLVDSNPGGFLFSANRRRVEGSSLFDPDTFAADRLNWNLLVREPQKAHSSHFHNIQTLHQVRARS